MTEPTPELFMAIYLGVQEKGDKGLLYVKGDTYAYLMPEELSNPEFRSGVQTMLKSPASEEVYTVAIECESKVHIVVYPKADVHAAVEKMR